MDFFGALSGLVDSPKETIENPSGIDFSRPGMAGYAVGTLSIFVFFRMSSLVPPGVFSFLALFAAVLAVNFFFAAVKRSIDIVALILRLNSKFSR